MSDEWMSPVELEMSLSQFRQLPRNPTYSYAYSNGAAWLSPRPRYYHALLDLQDLPPAPPPAGAFDVRRMDQDDWEALPGVFASAFERQPPFGGMEDDRRVQVAGECLALTRQGRDGPWIEVASFVATGNEGVLLGAIMPTLLPNSDPTDWDSYSWADPPPPDSLERGLGRPHLTWIFVSPLAVGRGVGTALLQAAASSLLRMGYRHLASTFLLGNDSSMLWHWRNGFQLVTYPGSRRRR